MIESKKNRKKSRKSAPSKKLLTLQKIRRRDLILLMGVVSLACFSLITVALLILRSQSSSSAAPPGATGVPGPAPTHTVTFDQATGLKQYEQAESAAKAWAEDAQLVSANANWPQILSTDQVGRPTTWNYRFYSPAKERLFFAIVEPDDQLRTVEHRIPVTLPPPVISLDVWSIDSPAALAIWLDYGGDRLLARNPGLEIVAQLRMTNESPNPVWVIVGLDERTNDIHVVAIDATEGVVVTTSPES